MRVTGLLFAVLLLIPRVGAAQGDPFGPEFRVNSYTTGNQIISSVAAYSPVEFVVVWTGALEDGSSFGVFGQRYDNSGPAGPEFRVNTYTTYSQYRPSVAADSSGNFVVVWESATQDGSARGVFGQRYANPGVPIGPEFRVNTYTTGDQYLPFLAAAPSGNFVVVWTSYGQDGSGHGVFGQRYSSTGVPLGPEFRVNTYTTNNQGRWSWRRHVATDASGNFVVVWDSYNQDGSGYGVFGQRYNSSGVPQGSEFRVNTYTTAAQYRPSVAADSSGNFVVAWNSDSQDGSDQGLFAQRYNSSGVPVDPEFRVNSYTTDSQGFSAVASDSAGNFVVVWQSNLQDGSIFGIFGQRYASSGSPLGPEFRANTFTTNFQSVPSVAADPSSGRFVVVWNSFDQDGSAFGLFGQRYTMIVPVELMHFRVE